jgi:hypothetical protein
MTPKAGQNLNVTKIPLSSYIQFILGTFVDIFLLQFQFILVLRYRLVAPNKGLAQTA